MLRTFGGTTHMNLPTRAAPFQLFNSTAATLASSLGLERADDAIVTGRCARQMVEYFDLLSWISAESLKTLKPMTFYNPYFMSRFHVIYSVLIQPPLQHPSHLCAWGNFDDYDHCGSLEVC